VTRLISTAVRAASRVRVGTLAAMTPSERSNCVAYRRSHLEDADELASASRSTAEADDRGAGGGRTAGRRHFSVWRAGARRSRARSSRCRCSIRR
jgi:hypothetical protein